VVTKPPRMLDALSRRAAINGSFAARRAESAASVAQQRVG
jgi:hypothetical protein